MVAKKKSIKSGKTPVGGCIGACVYATVSSRAPGSDSRLQEAASLAGPKAFPGAGNRRSRRDRGPPPVVYRSATADSGEGRRIWGSPPSVLCLGQRPAVSLQVLGLTVFFETSLPLDILSNYPICFPVARLGVSQKTVRNGMCLYQTVWRGPWAPFYRVLLVRPASRAAVRHRFCVPKGILLRKMRKICERHV